MSLLGVAAVAFAASPAQAVTGGASTIASSLAQTGQGLTFGHMRTAGATWYGPGFYGSQTACGQVLRPQTIGVAHRRLPCGTAIKVSFHGHRVVARVIDRGPYRRGYAFDLTNGARAALHFNGSARVHYAIAKAYTRR